MHNPNHDFATSRHAQTNHDPIMFFAWVPAVIIFLPWPHIENYVMRVQHLENLYVDDAKFDKGGPTLQRPRTKKLKAAGAKVFLCKGKRARGSFHYKAIIIDRRYMWTGNENCTDNSLNNNGLCLKISGPVVKEVLEELATFREKYKVWDGR